MKKLPYVRRQEILELINKKDHLDVGELSKKFDVSYMTIHRDLEHLEKNGEVSRIYGGVKAAPEKEPSTLFPRIDLTIEERFKVCMESKEAIAKKAASFVQPGDIIALDPSTTTLHMCTRLQHLSITVLTNSLSVALQLSSAPKVKVVVLGGVLRQSALTLSGDHLNEAVRKYNINKCFMSASCLDFVHGLTDLTVEEAESKRAVIKQSADVFVLADKTKLGKSAPYVTCEWNAMTAVITGCKDEMDKQQQACLQQYEQQAVPVLYTE